MSIHPVRCFRALVLLVLILCSARAAWAGPNVSVTIDQPVANALVADTLAVSATVSSVYALQSVHAQVETVDQALAFSSSWTGTLAVGGLVKGTKVLTVTATDILNESSSAQVQFVKDMPPVVTVTSPSGGTVAQPNIDLAATCMDDDAAGCTSLQVVLDTWPSGTVVATGTTAINETISLLPWDGEHRTLAFIATDSSSQVTSQGRDVFIDSSPKLDEIITLPGAIVDFDGKTILFWDPTSNSIYVYDRETAQSFQLPNGGVGANEGHLTHHGVIGARRYGGDAAVFEWTGGQPVDVGTMDDIAPLRVMGEYALWHGAGQLVRRDLATGTNIVISTSSDNVDYELAENGDVVFQSPATNAVQEIFLYSGGNLVQISQSDGTFTDTRPRTDGINVVYRRQYLGQGFSIMLHGSSGDVELASQIPNTINVVNHMGYTANTGYVAFTKLAGGALQVFVQPNGGQPAQLSIWGSDSMVNGVNPLGEVTLFGGGSGYPDLKLYRASAGVPPEELCWAQEAIWRCGRWHIRIGRSLFGIVGESDEPNCAGWSPGGGGGGAGGAGGATGVGGAGGGGAGSGGGQDGSGATSGAAGGGASMSSGAGGQTSAASGGERAGGDGACTCNIALPRERRPALAWLAVGGCALELVRRRRARFRSASLTGRGYCRVT